MATSFTMPLNHFFLWFIDFNFFQLVTAYFYFIWLSTKQIPDYIFCWKTKQILLYSNPSFLLIELKIGPYIHTFLWDNTFTSIFYYVVDLSFGDSLFRLVTVDSSVQNIFRDGSDYWKSKWFLSMSCRTTLK